MNSDAVDSTTSQSELADFCLSPKLRDSVYPKMKAIKYTEGILLPIEIQLKDSN